MKRNRTNPPAKLPYLEPWDKRLTFQIPKGQLLGVDWTEAPRELKAISDSTADYFALLLHGFAGHWKRHIPRETWDVAAHDFTVTKTTNGYIAKHAPREPSRTLDDSIDAWVCGIYYSTIGYELMMVDDAVQYGGVEAVQRFVASPECGTARAAAIALNAIAEHQRAAQRVSTTSDGVSSGTPVATEVKAVAATSPLREWALHPDTFTRSAPQQKLLLSLLNGPIEQMDIGSVTGTNDDNASVRQLVNRLNKRLKSAGWQCEARGVRSIALIGDQIRQETRQ